MVFQNPFASFNPQKTAEQIFVELGRTHGMSRAEALGRASELLEMVNLLPQFEMLKRYPKTLSGGQLQRLAIARALMLNPSVLIADEPVSALDVSVQAQILNQFVELRDKLGLSILFISHDLTVVSNICDTVAVVYLGALMEIAPVRKLFGDVLHPYSEALISAKPKNHPKDRSERIILGGDVPNAIDIGPGCRFADRCRYRVDEICRKETPQLKEVKADRRVACHFPLVGKSII
jgi:peptide/nickel transport system ATP-binding protein/oligopeptide transport system ATP-binding protein